jgi:hypothetical protein
VQKKCQDHRFDRRMTDVHRIGKIASQPRARYMVSDLKQGGQREREGEIQKKIRACRISPIENRC